MHPAGGMVSATNCGDLLSLNSVDTITISQNCETGVQLLYKLLLRPDCIAQLQSRSNRASLTCISSSMRHTHPLSQSGRPLPTCCRLASRRHWWWCRSCPPAIWRSSQPRVGMLAASCGALRAVKASLRLSLDSCRLLLVLAARIAANIHQAQFALPALMAVDNASTVGHLCACYDAPASQQLAPRCPCCCSGCIHRTC